MNIKMMALKIALALTLLIGVAASANASVYFNFSESGTGIAASGVLTTTDNGGGNYTITAISGTFNGDSMTLIAPGGFQGNDNTLFFPGAPGLLDFSGFSFVSNSVSYNTYYSASGSYCGSPGCYGSYNDLTGDTPIQFNVSPVPEPSTWAMMILGFLGLGFMAYRRNALPVA